MIDQAYRAECARQFRALGCVIVPMHFPEKGRCSCEAGRGCSSSAKHPALAWHALGAQSRDELDAMLRAYPRHNLGAKITRSRLVVIEVEPAAVRDRALERFEQQRGRRLPSTLTVNTAHGGQHLYFRLLAESAIPGRTIRWLRGVNVHTVDIMMIPPSRGMDRREYAFAASSATTPAPLPGDILGRLQGTPGTRRRDRRQPHRTLHAPGRQDRALLR